MKKEIELDQLEDVNVRFTEDAFRAKSIHCSTCKQKAERVSTEIILPNGFVTVRLDVWRCPRCHKEYLNFEAARKLDRALIISRAMAPEAFKRKRSLSFDGDSYIFRIPADVARNLGKNPHADLTTLSSRDLLIHLD